jgi:predicted outer membrane protein
MKTTLPGLGPYVQAGFFALSGLLGPNVMGAASRLTPPLLTSRSLVAGIGPEFFAADILRPSEQTFLEKVSALSGDEMRMAQLGVAQAASSDVRSFAQTLVTDQRQLHDAVEALRQRKGAVKTSQLDKIPEKYQRLAAKSGGDFDREFIRAAGDADGAMLAWFEQALADAKDDDVRELAGTFLPMLREHGNRLIELRRALE